MQRIAACSFDVLPVVFNASVHKPHGTCYRELRDLITAELSFEQRLHTQHFRKRLHELRSLFDSSGDRRWAEVERPSILSWPCFRG
jgi:hypothetical protein